MIKEAIVKIVSKEDLTYEEAYTVMNEIMSGETTPTQNAAFLASLSTKSARAETTAEIAGCAAAMREKATPVDAGPDLFEIVGPPLQRWWLRRAACGWQNTATGQPPARAVRQTAWKRWA